MTEFVGWLRDPAALTAVGTLVLALATWRTVTLMSDQQREAAKPVLDVSVGHLFANGVRTEEIIATNIGSGPAFAVTVGLRHRQLAPVRKPIAGRINPNTSGTQSIQFPEFAAPGATHTARTVRPDAAVVVDYQDIFGRSWRSTVTYRLNLVVSDLSGERAGAHAGDHEYQLRGTTFVSLRVRHVRRWRRPWPRASWSA